MESVIPTAGDCRVTLAVMAGIALLAVPGLFSLPHDAGAVLRGHRRRVDQRLAEDAVEQ